VTVLCAMWHVHYQPKVAAMLVLVALFSGCMEHGAQPTKGKGTNPLHCAKPRLVLLQTDTDTDPEPDQHHLRDHPALAPTT
jgi:hypothetical protein